MLTQARRATDTTPATAMKPRPAGPAGGLRTWAVVSRAAAPADDLFGAAALPLRAGAALRPDVRWIRSSVVREDSGELATVWVYRAPSEAALREYARAAGLRVDEILPTV